MIGSGARRVAPLWAGYLAQGRGLTIVDTRKTYPVPTGLGHAISYLPAGMVTAADDARVREVVVGDAAGQRRRGCLSPRQPEAHAEAVRRSVGSAGCLSEGSNRRRPFPTKRMLRIMCSSLPYARGYLSASACFWCQCFQASCSVTKIAWSTTRGLT